MNIILKKWDKELKDNLIEICNKVDRSFLSDRLPYPYTEASADWYLGMVAEHDSKDGVFRAIIADGKVIGNISVEQKSDVYGKDGDIGDLLLTDYWSKGIMIEAVRQICEIAFSELSIIRITGLVSAREGRITKNAVFNDGKVYDLCLFGKLI